MHLSIKGIVLNVSVRTRGNTATYKQQNEKINEDGRMRVKVHIFLLKLYENKPENIFTSLLSCFSS